MVELELEAKELKKRERFRRGTGGCDRPISPSSSGSPSAPRQKLSPREVEQLLPQAMRDSMMSSLIMDKPRPKSLHLENNNNSLLVNEVMTLPQLMILIAPCIFLNLYCSVVMINLFAGVARFPPLR